MFYTKFLRTNLNIPANGRQIQIKKAARVYAGVFPNPCRNEWHFLQDENRQLTGKDRQCHC
ncbi:Uncharacterized protein APZ42_026992 [Daphnia magna]|uniref:Uncharacterized protein n=1 Tax=Daphnia magna TaxID=35525 RepID=A0A164RV29_9CRUS|nr:Uncharacterized protein APZ42_026992 [Daphnia magna]